MKIIELRTENIKNLKVVSIRPDGAVILEGKNGAGKSAVLDSIFMALTGKKIEEPIRNGEKRAEIDVDLGTYKIKRVYTEKGDRLEVRSKEGMRYGSPQKLLNEILGNMSFDPLQFAQMGKTADGQRKQREILSRLVGLDFTELNERRKSLYDERTIKYREIKGGDPGIYRQDSFTPLPLEALISNMPSPAPGTPRQEISMADVIKEVADLEAKADLYAEYEKDLQSKNNEIAANCSDMAEYQSEIESLEERIVTLKNHIIAKNTENSILQESIDKQTAPEKITPEMLASARQKFADIEEKNKAIRDAIEYDTKRTQLEAAKKVIVHLEEEMAKIDLEKNNRIKEAVYPIAGLALTDEYITYNGKPFGQLSTGEQIRISTAMAMAMNPTLKVILIREGSLLDKAGLKEIVTLAQEQDYQLWIECVRDEKEMGIYIENGEIKD